MQDSQSRITLRSRSDKARALQFYVPPARELLGLEAYALSLRAHPRRSIAGVHMARISISIS